MKALGLKSTSHTLGTVKPKESPSLNATHLKVFLCVIALLAAVAAICVWQMNVGGTGNWITFTLTGVSGALLIGVAIETMIASCKSRSKSVAKTSREKQAPSMLPKPTPKLTAAEIQKEQAKEEAVKKFYDSYEKSDLTAAGLTAFSTYQRKPLVLHLISERKAELLYELLKGCTFEEFAQALSYLSSETPSNIIDTFAVLFLSLLEEPLKQNKPISPKYLPKNNVFLVLEMHIQKCIEKRADQTLASILPNYPTMISPAMFTLLKPTSDNLDNTKLNKVSQVALAHNQYVENGRHELLVTACKQGDGSLILQLMLRLSVKLETRLPSGDTVSSLLIKSKRTDCLQRLQTHFASLDKGAVI